MKCELMLIGKTRSRELAELMADYTDRVGHYMPFSVTTLNVNCGNCGIEDQKALEAQALMKRIKVGDYIVLLDERGIERSSVFFAEWLRKKRLQCTQRLVFIIGGPYGFANEMYERADESVSLSQMTFSHQMVRVIFTEQLYRACTILKGEKYHH